MENNKIQNDLLEAAPANSFKIERLLLLFMGVLVLGMIVWPVFLGNSSLDIHLHDTYFIIGSASIAFFGAIYFFILFVLYAITRKISGKINFTVAVAHIIITIAGVAFFLLTSYFVNNTRPRRYVDYSGSSQINFFTITEIILAALFILAQIVFFIYFFVTVFRKRKINF